MANDLDLKKFKIKITEEGKDAKFLVSCEYMDGDADNFWKDKKYYESEDQAYQYYNFMACMHNAQDEDDREYDYDAIADYIKDNPDVIEMIDPNFDKEEYSEKYNYENGLKYFIQAYFADEEHKFCNKEEALERIEDLLRNKKYIKFERSTDDGEDAYLYGISCTYSINNIIYNLEG